MTSFLYVIWTHFVADFYFQSRTMAENKSTSFKWLSIHVAVYTAILLIFGWKFAIINGVAHWIVDAITSRITKYLWMEKRIHDFFVVIGLDQAIHMTILYLTIPLIGW